MNLAQRRALQSLCDRYGVPFDENDYHTDFSLPEGYVSGWIGGDPRRVLFVGCDPEGRISS